MKMLLIQVGFNQSISSTASTRIARIEVPRASYITTSGASAYDTWINIITQISRIKYVYLITLINPGGGTQNDVQFLL